jgi:amicyanin
MRRLLLPVLALIALALAGCGSSSSSSSSSAAPASSSTTAASSTTSASGGASPSAGQAVHVSIKSLAFNPATVSAKVGQTVTWTNDDSPPHNVTYVKGPKFDSSPTMNPGATFHIKLTQPGTIDYFCSIHPFMKGSIVVSG